MARDYEEAAVEDAKDNIERVWQGLLETRADRDTAEADVASLTEQRDSYQMEVARLAEEIERLKSMAFEEIVREVAAERMGT